MIFGVKMGTRSWKHTKLKVIVFKRDNYTCVKCGHKRDLSYHNFLNPNIFIDLVADHILPVALGGKELDINNIQTLCLKCNKEKNAKDQSDIARKKREWKNK